MGDAPNSELSGDSLPGEGNDAGTASAVTAPDAFIALLHSGETIRDRVSQQAFHNFIRAVDAIVKEQGAVDGPRISVSTAVALLPGSKPVVDIHCFPAIAHDPRIAHIERTIAELRCPPVHKGPVAFVIFEHFAGGSVETPEGLPFPFHAAASERPRGSMDALIYKAAGVEPPPELESAASVAPPPRRRPRSWWQRLWSWLRGGEKRPSTTEPSVPHENSVGIPPLPAEPTIDSISRELESDPNSAELLRARGELYQAEQRWEDAIGDYNHILRNSPDDAAALAHRGGCYLQLRRFQPALADFNAALKVEPTRIQALLGRADVYRELEAWSAAEDDLTTVIRQRPDESSIYLFRARLRAATSRLADAMTDVEAAIVADPHNEEGYAFRGWLRSKNAPSADSLNEALNDLLHAAKIAADDPDHLVAAGELQLQLGRIDDAIATCERILKRKPDCGPAFGIRGMATDLRDGPTEDVIRDCTTAIDREYRAPMVYMARARAHFRNQDKQAALDDYDRVVEMTPESAEAYNERGAVYGNMKMADAARSDFERAIELAPAWPLGYLNRGLLQAEQGEFAGAIEDFTKAIECDPENPVGYLQRAKCHDAEKDAAAARADYDAAVRLNPKWAQALCDRGAFLCRCGELEQARVDLNRAIELQKDFTEALYHRAEVLAGLQELDAALDDLNRLIELMPELTAAYSGRASVWMMKGEPERAEADFETIISRHPEAADDIKIQHVLLGASYHMQQENFDQAIEQANKAMELQPDCLPAYRVRAGALWYSEQFVEAIDDYTWLIEREEDLASCYSSRGQIWSELGEYELALKDLDEALKHTAGAQSMVLEAYIRNGRGLALAALGRRAEASIEFERSVVACPQNAWTQFNLGMAYYNEGELKPAAQCFRLALELKGPALTPRKRSRAQAFLKTIRDQGVESRGEDNRREAE